jgi:hypothetical protein
MSDRYSAGIARLFCSACVVVALAIASSGVVRNFPNVDEIGHLPASESHWRFGTYDLYRVNPPLSRIWIGLTNLWTSAGFDWSTYTSRQGFRPEFSIGLDFLYKQKLSIQKHFVAPRFLNAIFFVVLAVVVAVWTEQVLGRKAACIALCLVCFSPSIICTIQSMGPDLSCVAIGVFAVYQCWRYHSNPSRINAFATGFAVGLAALTKLTWLTLFVSIPLCFACVAVFGLRRFRCRFMAIDATLCFFSAFALLNAAYLFEGSGEKLGEYRFCSQALGGARANTFALDNRFKDSWLANLPVPVPRNYLLGIDYLKYEVEQKYWSFLMGEWKFGSWPHYYVMTTLFKTPEPTLLAALIGLGVLVVGIRRKMVELEVISMFLFLIIPAAVCFASVSLQGGFNHHHRYVLMIYPPMFALAAYVASPVAVQLLRFRLPLMGPTKRSIAIPLAVTLVVLSAASSLRVHPYYTSYFNTLSGGPENGWRLLGFSNIDWGQDILEVDKWLKAHPDRRPLVMDLDYFGMNGKLFDVPTSDPPQLPKHAWIDEVRSSITETQWWIISVKKLYNYPGHHGLEYLQQLEPVDKIAFAYHVYRIDPLPPLEPATDTMQESDHPLDSTPATPRP